jgi:hypothetical protein
VWSGSKYKVGIWFYRYTKITCVQFALFGCGKVLGSKSDLRFRWAGWNLVLRVNLAFMPGRQAHVNILGLCAYSFLQCYIGLRMERLFLSSQI